MRTNALVAACSLLLVGAAGCSAGLDLTICGTAEWAAKSRGADTTTNREITVDFTTEKRFADAAALFDSVDLAGAVVEVIEVGAENAATKVSGKIEVGPEDGSQKVLIAEYTDLTVAKDAKLELTLSAEGKALAQSLLKGGNHKFKAFITGRIDKAPADVKLRAKFNVVGKVSGGGVKTDLGCVSFGIISDEPAPSCDPNPCKNGGTCAATAEILACTCAQGFSGIQCETAAGDLCANVSCQGTQTCNPANGQCEGGGDLCANVNCQGTQTCNPTNGQCEGGGDPNACAEVVCQNGGTCTPTTGACTCINGYTGANCEIAPPPSCVTTGCPQNFTCNEITGACETSGPPDCRVVPGLCPPEWTCNQTTGGCEQREADPCKACQCDPGAPCAVVCASTPICGGQNAQGGQSCGECTFNACAVACNIGQP